MKKEKYYFCANSQDNHVDVVLDPQAPQKQLFCSVFSAVEYSDCKRCPHYRENVVISDIGSVLKGIVEVEQKEALTMTMQEYEEESGRLEQFEKESEDARENK